MADTLTKPKMQLRSSPSMNGGDKSPLSPSTKLLISHGKPNFTIQRSPKTPQSGNPLSPPVNNNNNNNFKNFNGNGYTNGTTNGTATNGISNGTPNGNDEFIVKSTKFNGVFKPSTLVLSAKQEQEDNEAAKVVLRRTKVPEPTTSQPEDEDASVPEFIRRQRRIQERLAKENILDFENRRSGYFTHVMISPSSPNRTSFVETMSSPAIVPSLEIPPPVQAKKEETIPEEVAVTNGNGSAMNGASDDLAGEEEVAKAIEEVNKAVEGEDDEKEVEEPFEKNEEPVVHEEKPAEQEIPVAIVATKEVLEEPKEEEEIKPAAVAVVTSLVVEDEPKPTNENDVVKQNGVVAKEPAVAQENGLSSDEVTISHTNGSTDGPCIPAPDPSGQLGVNYEPKTVVSFSKDLGSEVNKYPDTVKVVKEGEVTANEADAELQEMAKLKFDIKADEQDVQVTPVLRAEE